MPSVTDRNDAWPADGKENRNDERAALSGIARFANAEN
jgi:hypothetical protein